MMATEYSISILEGGARSDEVLTYYCHAEPKIVKKPVEGSDEMLTFVRFFPKNGPIHRVNRANYVPIERVVVITLNDGEGTQVLD
jgi:hypothetical protein